MTPMFVAMMLVVTQATPADAANAPPVNAPEPISGLGVALTAISSSAATGLGACSWFARETGGGLGCTIAAGSLSLGLLLPVIVMAVIRGQKGSLADELVNGAIVAPVFSIIAAAIGVVAGGVVAGLAGSPPGVQRGVVGVSASGLLLTTTLVTCFTLPYW